MTAYPWPVPPGATAPPVWTDRGFVLDGEPTSVVSYAVGASGWSDDLTLFSEEHAGSDHPIDVASRELALGALDRLARRDAVVLEVGCSSGYLLRLIRERLPRATVIGADYVLGPLKQLAPELPDVPIVQFDLVHCPLPSESVDAVIMMNVLEHIEDDAAALRQVYRILRPGGRLILEVPAGPHLYDIYDKLLMHYRRYAMSQVRRLFVQAGFEIEAETHIGAIVFPAFALVKLWHRLTASDLTSALKANEEQTVARCIRYTASSGLVKSAFKLERYLGRWIRWPFGTRCALIGRKPARERPGSGPEADRAAASWPGRRQLLAAPDAGPIPRARASSARPISTCPSGVGAGSRGWPGCRAGRSRRPPWSRAAARGRHSVRAPPRSPARAPSGRSRRPPRQRPCALSSRAPTRSVSRASPEVALGGPAGHRARIPSHPASSRALVAQPAGLPGSGSYDAARSSETALSKE
jgi:SAM-dependent methyltransferase